MKFASIAVVAIAFLFSMNIANADDPTLKGLKNKPDFLTMKTQVDKDLEGHQKYKEISPDDLKTVQTTLDRMNTRWQGADDIAHLSPEQRVDMANDQDAVATILNHASAESRVVCERIMPTNSHLPQNVCKTVAQRKRDQKEGQEMMQTDQGGK